MLVDDGRLYAEKLEKAGVKVKYKMVEGLLHAFMQGIDVYEGARQTVLDTAEFLNE